MSSLEVWKLGIDILSSGGVAGVLFLFTWLFLKGQIIPRNVVDSLLENSENNTRIIVTELGDSVQDAVREGVRQGVLEAVSKTVKDSSVF